MRCFNYLWLDMTIKWIRWLFNQLKCFESSQRQYWVSSKRVSSVPPLMQQRISQTSATLSPILDPAMSMHTLRALLLTEIFSQHSLWIYAYAYLHIYESETIFLRTNTPASLSLTFLQKCNISILVVEEPSGPRLLVWVPFKPQLCPSHPSGAQAARST